MLSQISQSSKRLEKIKKYKNKLGGSGFQFLLQSMDRDKENHVPNARPIQYGQLTQSVNIDSQITMPACHTNPLLHSTKPNIYIENVRVLDTSDVSITDVNEYNQSKNTTKYASNQQQGRQSFPHKIPMKQSQIISKGTEKSHLTTLIDKNEIRSIDKYQFEDFLDKTKAYLLLSSEIVDNCSQVSGKARNKIKKYAREVEYLMEKIKISQECQRQTRQPSMARSFMLKSKDSEQYLKKINRLESEREKLNNLISKHELANIKMFVKINEGESEEIERCKKQLGLLFNKYKELEKIIKRDKKQLLELARQKQQLKQKNVLIGQQNQQLLITIERLNKQLQRSPSYLSIQSSEDYHCNSVKERSNKMSKLKQQSGCSYFDSSLNSRGVGQLRIQSLRNSHISYEEQPPRSSLTTVTSRAYPKKSGRIGINLNALVESIRQQNLKKLMQQPQNLKRVVEECRKTILQMQNVINQQNGELEVSIKALEENQENLRSVQDKLRSCEGAMNSLTQQLKRQKMKKSQLQAQLKQKCKSRKNKSCKKSCNEMQNRPVIKEDRIKVKEGKEALMLDLGVDLKYLDQYRIIATQAQTLEKYLRQKQKR